MGSNSGVELCVRVCLYVCALVCVYFVCLRLGFEAAVLTDWRREGLKHLLLSYTHPPAPGQLAPSLRPPWLVLTNLDCAKGTQRPFLFKLSGVPYMPLRNLYPPFNVPQLGILQINQASFSQTSSKGDHGLNLCSLVGQRTVRNLNQALPFIICTHIPFYL